MVVALIVYGIVTVWIVSMVDFDSGRVYLDRYVLRTGYGVGVYNSREVVGLRSNS